MDNKSLEIRIAEIEKRLNIVIPKVYKNFLAKNAGLFYNGVMCLDDGVLYDIEIIEERYTTLEFDKYTPKYIPIGNDNGDYELVIKSGSRVTRFGMLEQGSIGILNPEYLQNFNQWYKNGHSFSFDDEDNNMDWSKMARLRKEVIYVGYGVTPKLGLHRFLFMPQSGTPAGFPVFPPS